MKNIKSIFSGILLLAASAVHAGVEMDLVTTNASGTVSEQMKLYAQSGNIRMDDIGGSSGENASMIFLGTEFIVLDHSNQTYIVIDEATMAQVGSQIDAAMQQMQAQLANMPPEQAAMVEQMMQGQMASMMGGDDTPAPVIQQSGSGQWQGSACTQYTVLIAGQITQMLCAAPLDDIDGVDEAMEAFENMAVFITSMADSLPGGMGDAMADNPMGMMDQIDGFPVITVEYLDGAVLAETTLQSVVEADFAASLFSPPENYTQQDPFAGQ
ncbi:MAG: hypothetical protein ACR2QT_15085 [Woeseiaceae bacterium]